MPKTTLDIKFIESFLSNKDNIKVLDIGCGNCEPIFELFNDSDLPFIRIVGVDSGIDLQKRPRSKDLNYEYSCITYEKENPNNIFEYVTDDGLSFLQQTTETFDLIIFNQFFHFFPLSEVKEYLMSARTALSENGIIYIMVANNSHNYAREANKHVFTTETISDLQFQFKILNSEKIRNWWEIVIGSEIPNPFD